MAEACIHYLVHSIALFELPPSPKLYLDIMHGYHDFFPYVHQHWTTHLLNWLRDCERESMPMGSQCRLVHALAQLAQALCATAKPSQELFEMRTEMSPSRHSAAPMSLPSPIASYLNHRNRGLNKILNYECQHTPPHKKLPEDSTNLEFMHSTFQEIVEELLSDPLPTAIDGSLTTKAKIFEFRVKYGTAPYKCRRVQCERAISGFISTDEREKHERSHKERFRCPELTCEFATDGFTSRQPLVNHLKKYHSTPNDVTLPEFPTSSSAPDSQDDFNTSGTTDILDGFDFDKFDWNLVSQADKTPAEMLAYPSLRYPQPSNYPPPPLPITPTPQLPPINPLITRGTGRAKSGIDLTNSAPTGATAARAYPHKQGVPDL